MGEAATDPGEPLDGGLGVGGGPGRVEPEVGFQGWGVSIEGRGRGNVPERADGVESAVPVGVEVSLDAGPGCPGQTDHFGSWEPVSGQPEHFHSPLNLGRGVMEAFVGDRGQDGRGDREWSHGILPGRKGR